MRHANQILHSFLALVLLLATTGVTLNKHYCMGRLKSVAINEVAKQCGEGEKMPCCEDIAEELKVEEVSTTSFDFDASQDLYELAIINFVLKDSDADFASIFIPEIHTDPPPPDRDITVLVQKFLI